VSEHNAEGCNNCGRILKHGGEPKPDDATGLCLLSLDGGDECKIEELKGGEEGEK
jgi:hypothetical protein